MISKNSLKNCINTFLLLGVNAMSFALEKDDIADLIAQKNIDLSAIKAEGKAVLPVLAEVYSASDDTLTRAKIAWVYYQLGWESEAGKIAMLEDVNTRDQQLRLQVQWALGRVSNDDTIVDILLDQMQNDASPLFRDKAACALASDQIHLNEKQRLRLLQGLVAALDDAKLQVRQIALQAIKIQTGQTKGFNPSAPEPARQQQIAIWQQWLVEYEKSL